MRWASSSTTAEARAQNVGAQSLLALPVARWATPDTHPAYPAGEQVGRVSKSEGTPAPCVRASAVVREHAHLTTIGASALRLSTLLAYCERE